MAAPSALFAAELPDAPVAQQQSTRHAVPATRPNTPRGIRARQWSDVVNPGETVPALTVRDKLLFPAYEEFRWTTLVPLLFDAEYGDLTGGDPKYGTNGEAFGKRLGASALHQATTRVFTDGLLPIAFHEDPRYYRQAYGSYQSRSLHALRQVVFTRSDSGQQTPNFAGILGRGMGAALTQAYYPSASIGTGVVMKTWGYSLLAFAGGNAFQEFWPDIRAKIFHHKQ